MSFTPTPFVSLRGLLLAHRRPSSGFPASTAPDDRCTGTSATDGPRWRAHATPNESHAYAPGHRWEPASSGGSARPSAGTPRARVKRPTSHRGRSAGVTGAPRSLRRRGLRHASVAVESPRDRLLAQIPAKLQAPVGEDGRVDHGDAGAVGGGARRASRSAPTRARARRRPDAPGAPRTPPRPPPRAPRRRDSASQPTAAESGDRLTVSGVPATHAASTTWHSARARAFPARSRGGTGDSGSALRSPRIALGSCSRPKCRAPRARVARRARA